MKALVFARNCGAARSVVALAALMVALPACQDHRLAQLEATQQRQARELADLRRQLAEKEEEVAQLETCVDDLESTVYDDGDSTAYDEDYPVRSSTTTL